MKFYIFLALAVLIIIYFTVLKKNPSSEQEINIYMVALEGTSLKGNPIGCNDILVPVSKKVKSSSNVIEEAISFLLAEKDSDELKNFVKGPQLLLFQVNIANGIADIYLKGDFLISGVCDIPRIKEQLIETIKQFPEIRKANIFINSQTLDSYLNIAKEGFN